MSTDTNTAIEPTDHPPVIAEIALDNLAPNPANLRTSLGDTRRLARSIAEVGIVVPLVVTPNDDGTYLVVAGHRRLGAARDAGLTAAPCVVRTLSEAEQCTVMLTENDGEHRQPLNPVEEAAGYLRLVGLGQSTRALAARRRPHPPPRQGSPRPAGAPRQSAASRRARRPVGHRR